MNSINSTVEVAVRFQGVSRYFGTIKAVDEITLDIHHGEFFTLLGPSGSGKTTCLRLIAGFDQPTSGRIQLFGKPVEGTPPYDRDVNTVFQDYALFPHMSVGENIGYGLMVKKIPTKERQQRVAEILEMVQLPEIADRRPSQLSGGQKQRVALARALINKPRVLLLDEPLGALDLKLRQQMQVELKKIQQSVGITFIFVTHDQEEALTMSDRIAVFNEGKIVQVGSPLEIYEQPRTSFVAGFVGTSNLIEPENAQKLIGESKSFAIRPEKIQIIAPQETTPADSYGTVGTIKDVVYLGINTRYLVELEDGGMLAVLQQNLESTIVDGLKTPGNQVKLIWQKKHTLRLE